MYDKMSMKRKGGMLETTLGKVILAVAILLVIIGMIWISKGKMSAIWGKLARILRFGG